MSIDFSCQSCGQAYRVKDEFAGRSTKCKKCGGAMQVPQPAPPQLDDLAPGGSWLNDELSAPAPKPAAPRRPIVAAQVTPADKAAAPKAKKTRVKLPSFGDSAILRLARGVMLSCVGAIMGALVWAAIAVGTGYQIGWIAWLVGVAAGGGMALGYEDDDGTIPGILAGVIALGGIVMAKIFIVIWVVASLASGGGDFKREFVAARLAGEALENRGVDLDNVSDTEFDAEYDKALESIANLSDEELDQVYSESMSRLAEKMEPTDNGQDQPGQPQVADVVDDESGPPITIEVESEGPSLASAFFSAMFSPIDALFILLAFFSAYKVGSGSIGS